MTNLNIFCKALATFEDANPANHNPGNTRFSPVGYLPKYGTVTCNAHGFAVFQTDQLGWEYLENLVHQRAVLHPTWTFYDFFSNYAPSADGNDPEHYAETVAADCGVPATTALGAYFQA
ncbi:MAG: hypothetical protein JO001_05825 [Alphaproteobacteria bacterium]|nr:hypothetical protein [Alphaproteobacteria bacterium]